MSPHKTTPLLRLAAALLLGGALLPAPALAQTTTTGVLTGTVVDASTKAPAVDVVVTATSPNLQGEQVVVTDATGVYRIPQLPPGTYTLRFEKESFRPYTRKGIELRLGQTVRLNAELLPEALKAEEIVVVGRPPTVDVGSARTGVDVGSDFVRNLAVVRPGSKGSAARSFESLAEVAPQANTDAYGVSINGATSPENAFLIDGLAVGSPAVGTLGTPLTLEFIQDVNVITGGYMPEYGRSTGGVMTVVTKSGSNEFHGSLFGDLTPGILEGTPHPIQRKGSVISATEHLWNQGDFGAELGGPILKDKLWFYVGLAPSFTRREVERTFNTLDPATGVYTPIAGTTADSFADQRGLQYIGKLTWLINPNHTLTLSVYGAPSRSGGNGTFAYDVDTGNLELENFVNGVPGLAFNGTYEALAHQNSTDSRDITLKLASSFLEKRLLLDVNVGWHHQANQSLPSDGSGIGSGAGLSAVPQFTLVAPRNLAQLVQLPDPSVCPTTAVCPVTPYLIGGPGFLLHNSLERYQANAIATYFFSALGHHVVKAGVSAEITLDADQRGYSGQVLYTENTAGTTFTDFRSYGYLTGPDQVVILDSAKSRTQANTFGGFIQDSWNVKDLVTVNAGLRYDAQTIYGGNGQLAIDLPNQVSPRVGVIYDFTQQGRSKLYANYARFYESASLAMFNSQFSNITRMRAVRSEKALNGGPGCNPLTQAPPYTECRDSRNLISSGSPETLSREWTQSFAINSPVDPDIKPQSEDELVLGGEYELLASSRVGASYTRRYVNQVIEDMSRNEATNYFIGNPGYGVASDFPKAQRNYDAVSVYFNKAFSDLWLTQASYTWSYLRGNYSGLYRPESGQLAPNVTSDFDLIALTINHRGPLPLDHTHSIKVYAAKEFILSGFTSLNLGLSYRGLSGAPINVEGANNLYGPGYAFIMPRGSGGRLPWFHDIDAHLAFNYRLSKDSVVTVSADAFNLFNFQAATAVDENYTFDTVNPIEGGPGSPSAQLNTGGKPVTPNSNYRNATAYQPPRSFRFGVRLSF